MSPDLDGERFFVVGWGELSGKLMPRLYSPSVVGFYEQLWAADGARHLRDLVAHGYYGVLPPGDSYADDLPIRFIRSAEMNSDLDVDLDDCPSVEEQYYIKKAQVQKNDVLLAVKGATIASRKCVAHVRGDVGKAIVNGSIYRMQVKPEVNPRFLAIVLSTEMLKRQMRLALTANNGVDYLDKSLIHHLVVPTPDRTAQDSLVAIYDTAMAASITAKREAAALLESIDDYLLGELGITLPPETENTLANRTFRVAAHELGGWRFDPLFHAFKMWHAIEEAGIPSARLGAICTSVKTGFAAGGNDQALDDGGIIQIRPTNIDTDRRLKFDRNIYISADLATHRPREILKPGEVLFNNTNSQSLVGKSTFFDLTDQLYTCSNHITRLTVCNDNAIAEYITAILNLYQRRKAFFSICTNWNNQSGVGADLLRKIIVPVPEMDVQQQIVGKITAIFVEAESLKTTATTELETAKREIEAILLGDAT